MATMTIRILSHLDRTLNKLSAETGILKSSLILYAINDRLRFGSQSDYLEIHPTAEQNLVRVTLRLPDELKTLVETIAKKNNISANTLINNCIDSTDGIYWSAYKPIAKVLSQLTETS